MNKITDRFLKLFYKISQIPRESGNEKRFANFLEMFAKENNLKCYRDKSNNVLIKKYGTINPYTIRFICKNGSEINCKDEFTATGNKQHSNNTATREKHRIWSA